MSDEITGAVKSAVSSVAKIKNLRWYICGLLFLATVVNYVDRQVIGALAPELQEKIGGNEAEYSNIVIAFQIGYAIMFLVWGRVIDKIGVKIGLAIGLIVWSIAGMAHGLAATAMGFGVARFFLGVGEAVIFPGSLKTTTEWFPKKERALANGLFNAGTNVGAIVAPATALTLSKYFGWQSAFIFTGGVGFLWLAAWWFLYEQPEKHPRLAAEELEFIKDGEVETKEKGVPWLSLLGYRQLWCFAFGKMLTDPVWWFYLFWLPKFLNKNYGIKGLALIPYLTFIYFIADIGSVGGGYMSSRFLKNGWTVNRARKLTLFCFAFIMPIVTAAYFAKNAWTAVVLISIAAASHQGWSANMYTVATDLFPKRAVASVIGIGSCAGAIGGTLMPLVAGSVLTKNPSYYLPMFIICGVTYLVAWGVMHLFSPRMEPAKL